MKDTSSRGWDWLAAIVLILAVLTVAARLDMTHWTPDLGYIEMTAVIGALLGQGLGASHFKRWGVFWLIFLYTLAILPLHLSHIITGEDTAMAQLASLGGRLSVSLGLLMKGRAITDYIFFVSLMALIYWGIGIYSGFHLARGRSIPRVALPPTLVMLLLQYYDGYEPGRIWALGFFFFLMLLLVGRINLLNSRERWQAQHIAAGTEPEFDLVQYLFLAAAVIVMLAWLLPAPAVVLPEAAGAWQNVNQHFDSFRSRMSDILAALSANHPNTAAADLYGDTMGLGRTAGSGQDGLFRVQAPPNDLPRLYWRIRVYDTYENGGWTMTRSLETPFDPRKDNLSAGGMLAAPVADFLFSWDSAPSALLATPFAPLWVSRVGGLQVVLDEDGKNDPLSWSANPSLQNGDSYLVRAILSNPTQKQLRESGVDYPYWVTDHYLQVPPNLAPDFTRLAVQITNGLDNNYDRAEAVTQYLRQNITYSQTLPPLPPGAEPLRWFLFDLKSGFCNYYASSEVLLLRSLHIPARLAVGFAQGKSSANFVYSVRGLDAHAWPEVYFPGVGWVQFEPTTSQASLVRPAGEDLNPSEHPRSGLQNNPNLTPGHNQDETQPSSTNGLALLGLGPWQWLSIIICSLVFVFLLTQVWRLEHQQSFGKRIPRAVDAFYRHNNLRTPAWVKRWLRWSEVSAAERAFHAVNQSLAWLGSSQPDHVTPAERVLALKRLFPEAAAEIDLLALNLETTLFTSHPVEAASAGRAAWRLRALTLRKILRRWIFGA